MRHFVFFIIVFLLLMAPTMAEVCEEEQQIINVYVNYDVFLNNDVITSKFSYYQKYSRFHIKEIIFENLANCTIRDVRLILNFTRPSGKIEEWPCTRGDQLRFDGSIEPHKNGTLQDPGVCQLFLNEIGNWKISWEVMNALSSSVLFNGKPKNLFELDIDSKLTYESLSLNMWTLFVTFFAVLVTLFTSLYQICLGKKQLKMVEADSKNSESWKSLELKLLDALDGFLKKYLKNSNECKNQELKHLATMNGLLKKISSSLEKKKHKSSRKGRRSRK